MSDSIRIMCADIIIVAFTATCCLALTVGAVVVIVSVAKWLKRRF